MQPTKFTMFRSNRPGQLFVRFLSALVITMLLFAGLQATPAQAAGLTLYVQPGASGDCTSWATACDLQTALTAATAGDVIWMAAGTYTPGAPGDRAASFNLKSDVKIYGGYSGTGTTRDWLAYPTILSGDLNGDDAGDFANYGDNSYHVVKAISVTGDTALDGIVIRGGNADGATTDGQGGGIHTNSANLSLSNMVISDNMAVAGGGMFNQNSTLNINNVDFTNNDATGTLNTDGGGGMFNDATTLSLDGVDFIGNSSYRGGGLLLQNYSNMTVLDGNFTNNTVLFSAGLYFDGKSAGGGILITTESFMRIDGTAFTGNQASDGGGITSIYTNPVVNNAVFQNNHAVKADPWSPIYGSGGGYFAQRGSPVLTNAHFISNTADAYGGGADNYLTGNARYFNVVFQGNTAQYGGGLNHASGNTTVANNTFVNNTASVKGGAVYNMDNGYVLITNNVIWGNSAPDGPSLFNDSSLPGTVLVSEYSILHDCFTTSWVPSCGTESATNLYTNPLFVDQAGGDFHLQSGSPAVDSGSNALIPADLGDIDNDADTVEALPLDMDNNPRIINDPSTLPDAAIVDRGAFERNASGLNAQDLTLAPNEDNTVSSQVSATGGTGLVFSVDTPPSVTGLAFTFNPDGTFSYTPQPNFNGPVTFTFMVTDDLSSTDLGLVTLNYQPVNDPPVNTTLPTISGTPHVGQLLTGTTGAWNDDLDGGTTTITYTYQWQRADTAAGANLADIPGATNLTYTPVLADNGKYLRITVTATDDGVGLPPTQSATASSAFVLIANAAPVADDLTLQILEDTVVNGQVTATDADGDALTFAVASGPAGGTLDFQPDGSFTYTPPANLTGDVTFTFTVSDGLGGTDTGTATITYQPVNDPPVNTTLPTISGTPHVGQLLTGTTGAWNDDLDGGTTTITYTYQWQRADTAAGANLADIPGATNLTYTPVLADNGKYLRITVTATDDGVGTPPTQSATASSAFVLIANAAPVADDLTLTKNIDEVVTGQVTAADADGDALTFAVASGPADGTLDFQPDGSFTYTPPAGFIGDVTFTFTVSDGLGGTDTGTVTISYPNPKPFKIYLPIIVR